MQSLILDYDAFIRSIKVNSNTAHALLLGAGASVSSGIQSATDCIWEWKKDIFVTKNAHNASRFTNHRDEQVRQHIQRWLDNEGNFPELNHATEYSFYAQKAYPIEGDRQSYFEGIIEGKKPAVGYQMMCLLAQAEIIRSVWTTNFDNLSYKAAIQFNMEASKISLGNISEIYQPYKRNNLLCIALHGDYKYGPMKNTDEELDTQEEVFVDILVRYLNDKSLIVSGYSGRDISLMDALTKVYSSKGAGRLYWCGRGADRINPRIEKLLDTARANGRTAFYVPTDGFDELMIGLSKACFESKPPFQKQLQDIISSLPVQHEKCTPFSMNVTHINSVLKGNLFPIRFPKSVFQFEFIYTSDEEPWELVKEATSDQSLVAGYFNGNVYAFGSPDKIHEIFKGRIKGDIQRSPLSKNDIHNPTISNLLIRAVTLSISQKFPSLSNNNKNLVWSSKVESSHEYKGIRYTTHRGIKFKFIADSSYNYLSCKPELYIPKYNDDPIPIDIKRDLKNSFFKKLYNGQYETFIDNFRKLLFKDNESLNFDFPADSENGFKFTIRPSPGFAKIMQAGAKSGERISEKFPQKLFVHEGIQYLEPNLIFSSLSGNEVNHFHPMKGLLNNRPYDFPISGSALSEDIFIGVVCPQEYSSRFYNFLNLQNQVVTTTYNGKRHNADYLIDFPSFHTAYGIGINIPHVSESRWVDCPISPPSTDMMKGAVELANILSQRIQRASDEGANVVTVFIPKVWEHYKSYDSVNEFFDLHDYLKAFAAEHQIATQLIEEKTLSDPLRGQITWWLSLSFYVKALKTPWILANTDTQTAYAGIGYSVNKHRNQGKVILGCSHIYNPQGQGLKYKLSKVNEPIWDAKHKNPYLPFDDAFKFGLSTAGMCRDNFTQEVKRVVVHKRTHFTEEEIKGIVSGLAKGGIHEVDLVEINIEDNIRYTRNKLDAGMPQADKFPINRGTCILLTSRKALLYTHGVVPSIQNPKFQYYLGGNGIPAPITIRKHYGESNISTIANEILGLTKVNWNSMDLYSILPATINSSNKIAQIGSLLGRFERAYDYRYFI
ncbi:SIR2 family protein [Spirosoma pollinicola]|uniref:Uncharacterized protein n=1 Tax=Spirosoma pollinicola TaxID=2057025 RepID=A0A2K8Z693_9BACT|nr:SIR2 family protein [Spirosoma pollinicola]AUD05407.1 hypothetical protein CWM47_28295 [Spirosoma pollinicola]